jgi:PEP-CTERM motif
MSVFNNTVGARGIFCFGVTAALLAMGDPALATPVTSSYGLGFSSPTQAIWGPGQSAADFSYSHQILGNTTFGMHFATGASSGTVSANYNGSVSVGYDNTATAGNVPLSLSYTGAASGGSFNTALGAYVTLTAYLPLVGGFNVYAPGYTLTPGATFTPAPPDSHSGHDATTLAATGVGPNVFIGSAQIGLNYNVGETAALAVSALNGTATAKNETTGDTRSAPFSLGGTTNIDLNLDEAGIWDVSLSSFSLSNLFSTTFLLELEPFIEYTIGGCNDPSTTADDIYFAGIDTCAGQGELSKTIASFPFYSNNPFGLAFAPTNTLPSFQIDVAAAPIGVPEPSSLPLTLSGLAGIFALGWVKRARRG